jgi:predicted phosphoribosyltransferase
VVDGPRSQARTGGVSPQRVFRDRRDAGRVLVGLLEKYRRRPDVVVLALPRGGVPVAFEVAGALEAPLDVFVVRKLGVPGHEEMAMGAIASGDVVVINDDVVRGLGITPEEIQRVAEREARELGRREQAYREGRPMPDLRGKTVILVDDGLATGSSMRAAIQALRRLGPARIVIAVPAAPESTCQELAADVDEVVCATTPSPFFAVGASYRDFTQTTDEEVSELLRNAVRPSHGVGGSLDLTGLAAVRLEAELAEEGVPEEDALFDLVGDAHFVLLGEASHGTHEFYEARERITRRLIDEKGFHAVVVEADWPGAYRVNRFVRGRSEDATAEEALRGFQRSRRGCGATWWCGTLWGGSVSATTAPPRIATRRGSMGWISTASAVRCRRWSPTSSASTQRRQRAPVGAMPASTTSAPTTASPTGTRRRSERASRVRPR